MSVAPMGPNAIPVFGGVLTVLFAFGMMVGWIVAFIMLIVAVWRAMRAHEQLAQSVNLIAAHLRSTSSAASQQGRGSA